MSIGTRTRTREFTAADFADRFGVTFTEFSGWRHMPYSVMQAQVSVKQAQEIADAYNISRPRCGETRWLEFKRFTLRCDRNGFFVVAFEYLDRVERILRGEE